MSIYAIDKQSDTPLYMQIRNNIEAAILSGNLGPGDKLPSVTALAKDIGVTQATVRRALQDLGKAGHTYCHVGRGTFIQDAANISDHEEPEVSNDDTWQIDSKLNSNRAQTRNSSEFAARRLRIGVGKALSDIMSLAERPGIIRFTRGVPDPANLPESFLQEITAETLQNGGTDLIETTDALGRYDLRREIADRFTKRGTPVTPEQVLITNGSLQAITLIAQANIDMKHNVICETPCFKGITDTFAAMGNWVETITRDSHGPIAKLPDRLSNQNPFLLYLCPYAHNPTGTNLSKERYTLLVEWAKRTGSLIVADEIFHDLCFDETPPSLMQELGADQTIVVSSLSKSVMTGLRLGWLISSPQRVQQLAILKRLMDQSCPSLIQGLAVTILKSGRFDTHTKKMKAIYQNRRDTLLKALQRYMPKEVTWTTPDGGYSLLLELPRGYSSISLFLAAIDKGVSILPGPLFDIDHRFVHCFRISYAWIEEEQIKEGIELLGSAVEMFLSRPPGDTGLGGIGSYQ